MAFVEFYFQAKGAKKALLTYNGNNVYSFVMTKPDCLHGRNCHYLRQKTRFAFPNIQNVFFRILVDTSLKELSCKPYLSSFLKERI